MRGTVLFPFKPGEHRRIAAKVIDFLGNEVVRVVTWDGVFKARRQKSSE
jgi:adenine-specific DNA-methyltransferase